MMEGNKQLATTFADCGCATAVAAVAAVAAIGPHSLYPLTSSHLALASMLCCLASAAAARKSHFHSLPSQDPHHILLELCCCCCCHSHLTTPLAITLLGAVVARESHTHSASPHPLTPPQPCRKLLRCCCYNQRRATLAFTHITSHRITHMSPHLLPHLQMLLCCNCC